MVVNRSFQLHRVFNLDSENRAEDTPTLIDRKDNVFIISNTKSKYPMLQLDLRLISELVVVIVSETCGGIAFACAGQPVITGYLLAGSIVGPGGFSFVTKMVQCPQQSGDMDHGFYVMRFMHDIVKNCSMISDLDKVWISRKEQRYNYSQDELNDVRDKWASYFTSRCT